MQQITTLSDDADQLIYFTLADGTVVTLEFIYRPAIQRWSYNLTYGTTLVLVGINLTVSPNILRQWRNVIKFGMAIMSTDGYDPVDIEDFENGRIIIYMLDVTEVQQVESEILAPIPLVAA